MVSRILAVMLTSHADSLVLREGEPAVLLVEGQPKPATKPLTAAQVGALVREIATPAAQQAIDARQPTKFRYASPERVFTVRAMLQGDVMVVDFTVDADAEFKRSTGTFRAIDADAGAAGDVPDAQTAAGDPGSAKIAMEKLLRMLVEHGGSDLHMRVGEPPIVRKSGEMERIAGQSKLDATAMEALLTSIMPERNRREFAETNDTDFAHEIVGVDRPEGRGGALELGVRVHREVDDHHVTLQHRADGEDPLRRRIAELRRLPRVDGLLRGGGRDLPYQGAHLRRRQLLGGGLGLALHEQDRRLPLAEDEGVGVTGEHHGEELVDVGHVKNLGSAGPARHSWPLSQDACEVSPVP